MSIGLPSLAFLCPSYSTSVLKLTLQADHNRKGKDERKKDVAEEQKETLRVLFGCGVKIALEFSGPFPFD